MIVHKKAMCKFVEERRRGRSHGNPQNTMSKSVEKEEEGDAMVIHKTPCPNLLKK
jgi:hypothetical protein